jgi:hypothetical protein
MFSSSITNINLKKLSTTELRTTIENSRQTRPFEIVRAGSSSNLVVEPGYKGITILNNSYFFPNVLFDVYVELQPGDRILLYGQNDPIQNGVWLVMSIVAGYVNIQRPTDYAKNTPIRSGQCVLVTEGQSIGGIVFLNITPEYDSNQNKIIAYNGTSPQSWTEYFKVNLYL